MRIVTSAEMRELESSCPLTEQELVDRAGKAIAHKIKSLGAVFCVLAGPGNNGADGLVAAGELAKSGKKVRIVAVGREHDSYSDNAARHGAVLVEPTLQAAKNACAAADVTVDAVYGTGKKSPIASSVGELMAAGRLAPKVVAVDLPSGLNGDTGVADRYTQEADITIAMGLPKFGHFLGEGPSYCGELRIADIGLGGTDGGNTTLLRASFVKSLLAPRPRGASKWHFGRLLIVAGSDNFLGAAELAAKAAVRSGVGITELALPRGLVCRVNVPSEVIVRPLGETADKNLFHADLTDEVVALSKKATALLVGPGLGRDEPVRDFLVKLLAAVDDDLPTVVDADGLNILADKQGWRDTFPNPLILTPHSKELVRLMGVEHKKVAEERLDTTARAAQKFNCTVVHKGAATVIAAPAGTTRIAHWVNSGLAKGGSGDVLAGLCGGLLAQQPDRLTDTASLAVYLHGLAAKIGTARCDERAFIPGDIVDMLGNAFGELNFGVKDGI